MHLWYDTLLLLTVCRSNSSTACCMKHTKLRTVLPTSDRTDPTPKYQTRNCSIRSTMSNQTSSGHDTSKDRQRTKSNSPKSIDTGIKERFSFEDLDGVRREDLHARSASEPLIDEQVMQRTLHPTTNQVRRKPVLSVDSVNPAVQGYGEVAQRSTASLPDTSRPRQPMSTSSGSNSPARSPAFKRFFNTYQQSRMPKKNIQQDREGSSSREGPTLSPLTPIAASVHDSLRRTNSVLDQVMDNENVASRSSGTRQPPLQPVMPRRSADNQGVMFVSAFTALIWA